MSQEVFEALTQALERGEDAALVTIVSANGSTPQRVGAKMLVFPDGRIVGTIGGGCYDNDLVLESGNPFNRASALVKYDLNTTSRRNPAGCPRRAAAVVHRPSKRRRAFTAQLAPGHALHRRGLAHTILYSARTCWTTAKSSRAGSASPTPRK